MVNESHKMLCPVQERLNFQLRGWLFVFHTRFKPGSANNDQPLLLSQVATGIGALPNSLCQANILSGKSAAPVSELKRAERRLASLSSRRSAAKVLGPLFFAFYPQITPHSQKSMVALARPSMGCAIAF